MIVCNGANVAIVVRPFVAGYLASFADMVRILPGQKASLFNENVSAAGQEVESVLVRDWGPPQMAIDEEVPIVRLWPDSAYVYKVGSTTDGATCRGFLVTFWDRRDKIRFWPTEQ